MQISLRISNWTHLRAPDLSGWSHFTKARSSYQCRTHPLLRLHPTSALLPLQLRWNSPASTGPFQEPHYLWKPSYKALLCRWLSFFSPPSFSSTNLHQAFKKCACLIATPEGQSPAFYPSAAGAFLAPNIVFSWFPGCHVIAPFPPLLPLHYLTSTGQLPRAWSWALCFLYSFWCTTCT